MTEPATTGPLVYVRLTRAAARGERDRAVHLTRWPTTDAIPDILIALCGKQFQSGEAERLIEIAGMPCFPCLINS